MKIPIKRYTPEPWLLKIIEMAADGVGGPPDAIASEYLRLLAHHEEETSWLIGRVKELELQVKD